MLLIHPPVAKPCEPPAGAATLAGALSSRGLKSRIWDANLECLLGVLGEARPEASTPRSDAWTARALRDSARNLAFLRSPGAYDNISRYLRAVLDLNRVIETAGGPASPVRLGLANYRDRDLLPVRSRDLLRAMETPEQNPFFPYFRDRLREIVANRAPAVVGISLNFLSQALCVFAMIGFLRREFPDLPLALGGGLVTSWVRRGPGFGNSIAGAVEHIVDGPGERSLLALAGAGDVSESHFRPDYGGLPLGDYLAPGLILPYASSSGCYWNKCSFCPERVEGNPYVPILPERAAADLASLVEQTHPVLIHLLDNAVSPRLMKALAAKPPGAPWYGFVRITRHLADEGFCMALKRSGCVMLKLGLESGDQGLLDRLGKGTDLEIASRSLRVLKKVGIGTYVHLLFGTPEETLAEAQKTLAFTIAHGDAIDYLNLALFNLPIDGAAAENLDTRMHYDGDLSLYTGFSHPRGWHRGVVRRFLDREFKRHPAIAAILRREPPIFTSNHAPLFTPGWLRLRDSWEG